MHLAVPKPVPTKRRNALLASRARVMRFAPTPSEEALWRCLSGSQLGVQFRRQVPIGRYIADFAASAAKLVVEVDGGCHKRRERADACRDEALRRAGYRVLRVDAESALRDLPLAVACIREWLALPP